MGRSARSAALSALVLLLATGCLTRPVREDVFKEDTIEVFLRSEKRWSQTLEKQYEHPVTIASVRMAHILSRVDMRSGSKKDEQRIPAIPTEMLFPIADGVSKALAQADENQEVVVMAIRRFKRFHVFERKYLTSFVAYAKDDRLYIHLARSEWEVPPRRQDNIPEPLIGEHPMKFRLYSGTAMTLVDAQSLAVEWRDPIFARPTRTTVLPTGEVMRKTILMESPPEEWQEGEAEPAAGPPVENLSPEQLRALADLEEQRQQGLITEADYLAERRKILEPL
ncbi:MAG TPA: hypothetical protein VIY27_08385 [Myxococcota bacterium]